MGAASTVKEPPAVYPILLQLPANSPLKPIALLANELISELLHNAREVSGGRAILFRITKVSLISNPTLLDAYLFWTQYIALCNQGKSEENGVIYKFQGQGIINTIIDFVYDMGQCGDLKLQWFGQSYHQYMNQVFQFKLRLPEIQDKLKALLDLLMNKLTKQQRTDKIIQEMVNQFSFAVKVCKYWTPKLEVYNTEIEDLQTKYKQIQKQADKVGEKLFLRYGAKKFNVQVNNLVTKEKYLMKVKCNKIIEECFVGRFRSELEQEIHKKEKEKRALSKPKSLGDDMGIGSKKFPWRIRWTGCPLVDMSLGALSTILSEHSHQLTYLRRFTKFIRFLTSAYKTQQDDLLRSWQIFCMSLTISQRQQLQNSIFDGLKKLKLSNQNQEQVKLYFIKYWEIVQPEYLYELEAMWKDYISTQSRIVSYWSDNIILTLDEFKQLDPCDRYNTLTSLAKNIYCLQSYLPIALKVYQQNYQKKIRQAREFMEKYQAIFMDSKPAQGNFDNIYKQFEQCEDQHKIDKKLQKFKYAYEKFH